MIIPTGDNLSIEVFSWEQKDYTIIVRGRIVRGIIETGNLPQQCKTGLILGLSMYTISTLNK